THTHRDTHRDTQTHTDEYEYAQTHFLQIHHTCRHRESVSYTHGPACIYTFSLYFSPSFAHSLTLSLSLSLSLAFSLSFFLSRFLSLFLSPSLSHFLCLCSLCLLSVCQEFGSCWSHVVLSWLQVLSHKMEYKKNCNTLSEKNSFDAEGNAYVFLTALLNIVT